MAASELQDRLDYLVSYASQLIFIDGATTDQSSVLDTFISESPEQVEIALLTATTTTVLAQYREKIYRQLVSQSKNADFNRPLNQLLAALNQHNGPLIISISKAENLPDKLLQELWELVLQSRFANNKQFLNVLLFTQGNWAKQARAKLQSRSGDKPLLLNSSSKLPKLKTNTSDLDKLITLKRQQFSERLQKRAQGEPKTIPLLKRKGAIATFVGIFILLFAGIVSLQYPDLFYPQQDDEVLLTATTPQVSELQATETTAPVLEQPQTAEVQDDEIADVNTSITALSSSSEEVQTTKYQRLAETNISSPDPLVTTWQNAIAKIDEPKQYLLPKPQQAFIEQQEIPAQHADSIAAEPAVKPAQINQQEASKPLPVAARPQGHSVSVTSAPVSNEMALQDGQYLIQISAMSDKYLLQQFMQDSPLNKQVWTYTTKRFGGDWFVLLYNQVYPSLEQARAALDNLPSSITTYEPFVKSVKQIKQELTQKGV
jgi:DamX protein